GGERRSRGANRGRLRGGPRTDEGRGHPEGWRRGYLRRLRCDGRPKAKPSRLPRSPFGGTTWPPATRWLRGWAL
ncbi:MAG: hypothetical protein AVDCRST_MAG55-3299, partial [uncultured Rubrobacteraceae bacterium]